MARKKKRQVKGRRPRQLSQDSNDAFSLERWLNQFQRAVSDATTCICRKREASESIDVMEVAIEPLFFRNCCIFKTIIYLLDKPHVFGAEILLRCLFEGTVTLQWCVVEPLPRGQQLLKHAWSGELDLADERFFKRSKDYKDSLRETISALDEDGVKGMPPFRQMVESVYRYRKDYAFAKKQAYWFYKHLCKSIHSYGVDPEDFLSIRGDTPEVCRIETQPSMKRSIACRSLACVIQMDNIKAISSFDEAIKCDTLLDLDEMWATLYALMATEERSCMEGKSL